MALGGGFAAGAASGLLGVGGGIVLVPVLVWLLDLPQHEAQATSLAAIVPIALGGSLVFHRAGAVDPSLVLPLVLGAAAGAPIGALVMRKVPEAALRSAFGVLTIVIGLIMLFT